MRIGGSTWIVSLVALRLLPACGGSTPPAQAPGDPAKEQALLEPSPKEPAPLVSADVTEGKNALARGDFAAAKAACGRAVKANPKSADAHACLGEASQTEPSAAKQAYREALKLDPKHEGAAQAFSGLLVDEGAFREAADVARSGLKAHPDNAAMHFNLALALVGEGDRSGAAKAFDDATKRAPDDPMFLLAYGQALTQWKETDRAVPKLKAAADKAPNNRGLLASVALEMQHAGAFADCIQVLDKAIALGDAAELRTQRGICKMGAKDKSGALDDLRTATERDPKYPPAHFYYAGRLAEAGKAKEALGEYEAYLKLAPRGPLAAQAEERAKLLRTRKK